MAYHKDSSKQKDHGADEDDPDLVPPLDCFFPEWYCDFFVEDFHILVDEIFLFSEGSDSRISIQSFTEVGNQRRSKDVLEPSKFSEDSDEVLWDYEAQAQDDWYHE